MRRVIVLVLVIALLLLGVMVPIASADPGGQPNAEACLGQFAAEAARFNVLNIPGIGWFASPLASGGPGDLAGFLAHIKAGGSFIGPTGNLLTPCPVS